MQLKKLSENKKQKRKGNKMVFGVCKFCGKNKDLTQHEIMAQSYGSGREDVNNVIPDICRECHDQLEQNMNKQRGLAGSGRNIPQFQNFSIGSVTAQLQTGSVYLNNSGIGYIDAGSPIYGMRCHNKITGEQFIESAIRKIGMAAKNVHKITTNPTVIIATT